MNFLINNQSLPKMDQGRPALDLCSRATRAIDEAEVQADPVAIYFALFYTYTHFRL